MCHPERSRQVRDSGADAQSRGLAVGSPLEASGSKLAAMYSKFRNRVMFPIASEAGKVIAFTGRTLATDEKAGPKYLNSPETAIYSKGKVLFNLDLAKEWIKKFDYAILVEGQMDCISVFAAGFHNVIASSGTAFTELQAKLLGRFTKNVIVNFDPDTAGAQSRRAHHRIARRRRIQHQSSDPRPGIRSRPLYPAQRQRCIRRSAQAFAEIFRLPDRAGPHTVPGTKRRGQAQGGELSAAARATHSQPYCAR